MIAEPLQSSYVALHEAPAPATPEEREHKQDTVFQRKYFSLIGPHCDPGKHR